MKKNLVNDIALLVLKHEVTLQPHINLICLPSPTANFDGKRCFATGWGKDSFSNILRPKNGIDRFLRIIQNLPF
jgi:hypothetical protein